MGKYWELSEKELSDFFHSLAKEKDTFRLPLSELLKSEIAIKEGTDNGKIAGIAGIRRHKMLPLLHIVVSSEFQGRGVGKSLMQKLHEIAKGRYNYIALSVVSENKPAVSLFQWFEYKVIGGKEDYYYMIHTFNVKGEIISFFLRVGNLLTASWNWARGKR